MTNNYGAIFKDGTSLSWEELRHEVNSDKYMYWASAITDTSIEDAAFEDCYDLTSIELPDNVTTIGNNAFDSCVNLTNITIPSSVVSIGEWAFYGCTSLIAINYAGTMEQWRAIVKHGRKRGNYFAWNSKSAIIKIICSDGSILLI